ncbi:MAG: AmmeMemoRadiSam system protein A [Gammaproteobacteria bacterium]|nr:AmmeMemoRadiSam system protein A [Gammaproteobacteria bacterium]
MPDEPQRRYSEQDACILLGLARESIGHGLRHGRALAVEPGVYAPILRQPGACFVSLHRQRQLRGCIGTMEARLPLVVQVAESAYAAAFRDWRFPPLRAVELDDLSLDVHVLSPLSPLPFQGLGDLHARLRVGQDGLLLELGARQAVFLPVMWEQLPDPQRFVAALLRKGEMDAAADLGGLRASRFTVDAFTEGGRGA